MIKVPLRPVPTQNLQIVLAGQSCLMRVYQLDYGLFIDMSADDVPVAAGAICQNLNKIVRGAYLGFAGNLVFWDAQGDSDPVYTGLGSRYTLLYLDATEVG